MGASLYYTFTSYLHSSNLSFPAGSTAASFHLDIK
jgi:hypothetical protein